MSKLLRKERRKANKTWLANQSKCENEIFRKWDLMAITFRLKITTELLSSHYGTASSHPFCIYMLYGCVMKNTIVTEGAVTPVFILLNLLTSKLQPKKNLVNRISTSKSSIWHLHLPFHVHNNLTRHLWLVKSFWCYSDWKCFILSIFASCTHKPVLEHTNLYPSAWKRLAASPHARSLTKPQSLHQRCFWLASKHWAKNIFYLKTLIIHKPNNQSFPLKKIKIKKHLMVFMDKLYLIWGLFPSREFVVTFYTLRTL